MSRREKLIQKFKNKPKDFTWEEMVRLLNYFDFELMPGQGSRRKFINTEIGKIIILHKPHPHNVILSCYMNYIYDTLQEEGLI